jgi:CHAT domain-containing protein
VATAVVLNAGPNARKRTVTAARSGSFLVALLAAMMAVVGVAFAETAAPAAGLTAESALERGDFAVALAIYENALANTTDPTVSARLHLATARCALLLGDLERARKELALVPAPGADQNALAAERLATTANLALMEGEFDKGVSLYAQAADLAARAGEPNPEMQWRIASWLTIRRSDKKAAGAAFGAIAKRAAELKLELTPNTLMAVAEAARLDFVDNTTRDSLALAYRLLKQAGAQAEAAHDSLNLGLVEGYLARLYMADAHPAEAFTLTSRALFSAQAAGREDWTFQWQWQSARLLQQRGELQRALDTYRMAAKTLQPIRPSVIALALGSGGSLRESLGDFYTELADLLLRQAGGPDEQATLREARETLELIKVSELEDYFRDDCLAARAQAGREIGEVSAATAAVYPVLLPDRIELLVSLGGRLVRHRVEVDREQVKTTVNTFRRHLEKRSSRQFLREAQTLYGWLIRPLRDELTAAAVKTLVVLPDDVLRTVPMAALHDGKQFLIEQFAVATSVGLSLTDPKPLGQGPVPMMVASLSKANEGFADLPGAAIEAKSVLKIYPGTLLENKAFSVEGFRNSLASESYGLLHIATHGQVERDFRRSFLLASDGRITFTQLDQYIGYGKFRDRPLELIALSACQTAAGDERAALGLAGIAIKAGARSALASLWFINDPAASCLIELFYSSLKEGHSKAESLQLAQRALLIDPRYQHPGYWAPFILIGNWL